MKTIASIHLLAVSATAFAMFTAVTPAQAQFTDGTISVDFKSTNNGGLTDPGQVAVVPPGTWNEIDGTSLSGGGIELNSSTNVDSGVALAFQADNSYNATNTMSDTQKANSPNLGLLEDYLISDSTTNASTVTLSGLGANSYYNLYLYNASDADGRTTLFSVNGIDQASTYQTVDTTYVAGDNYVPYLDAESTGSGTLTVSFYSGGNEGDLDGFQITAVPEPSTWAMLGLGGAGLLSLGWRQRRGTRA